MLVKLLDEQLQDVSGGWAYTEFEGECALQFHSVDENIKMVTALGKKCVRLQYIYNRLLNGHPYVSNDIVTSLGTFKDISELVNFLRTDINCKKYIECKEKNFDSDVKSYLIARKNS